ncbi:hypothetical protein ACFY5H_34980 [Streptomyces sp. NPDC013012]|uniref:hypothetical protein n=1 Tax=Streptomyces sp. NPDC013012 TaxID=3364860 RepID=UPI00368B90A5
MNEIPAYRTVRTDFTNNQYEVICKTFGGGHRDRIAWLDLANALSGRPGWRFMFDFNDKSAFWSLGALSESMLQIHVAENGQYQCHDHRRDNHIDSDTVAADIPAMEAWLEGQETAARRPSAALLEMARVNNWQTLKGVPITVRVSWSDGRFCATAYQLDEASFGTTLAEAVNGAGEMICRFLGAPVEVAKGMNLSVELDASATTRVRTV